MRKMNVELKMVCLLIWVASLFAFPAWGDEISDQIGEGRDYYRKGDASQAIVLLNFAIGQIQQKLAFELKGILPEPLAGWKAEESTGRYGGIPFQAKSVSSSRRYYVEDTDKDVVIDVVTDSPLLRSVITLLSDPALTTAQAAVTHERSGIADGASLTAQSKTTLVKIKGRKAVQEYMPEDREAEINIVVGSRMLITVSGQGAEVMDAVLAYANAVDYEALEKFLEK